MKPLKKHIYPGIKELLKERMKDLEKRDCGIVVAGNGFRLYFVMKHHIQS